MSSSGGRSALALGVPIGIVALLVVALGVVVVFVAFRPPTAVGPAPTQLVAGTTDAPTDPVPADSPGATGGAAESIGPEPTEAPDVTAGPGGDPPTAIVPGNVDRSSLDVSATYRVNAAITVRNGKLDVSTRIVATNQSGGGIDRLELNTVAARLGGIDVYEASVDGVAIDISIDDQTVLIPLGGVLPDGASATILLAYRASLRPGLTGSDWMFSRAGGTLALYRWIPWISRSTPFARPNYGDPFVTPSSPRVDVEILTDEPMVLAAPAADIDEYTAGPGNAWAFSVTDVRDVSVVLAPDFRVSRGKANGVAISAYTRPGGLLGAQLVALVGRALESSADLVNVVYPWTTLVVVETAGGVEIESPGMVWIPVRMDVRNRTYALYHGVAQQWFYALVGNDQRAEPFADEAPSDLIARTALGLLRPSRCSRGVLDESIAAYDRTCYYEVVIVQGGLVLDEIRKRMGTDLFWAAMSDYLEAHRYEIGGTRALLEALRAGTSEDLLPLLKVRFPDLY